MPYEMNGISYPRIYQREAKSERSDTWTRTFSFALERDMYNKKMYNKKEICIIKKLGLEDYSLGIT